MALHENKRESDKENIQLHYKIKGTTKWVEETRQNVMEVGPNPTSIWNKEVDLNRINADKFKGFHIKLSKIPRAPGQEERWRTLSEGMKKTLEEERRTKQPTNCFPRSTEDQNKKNGTYRHTYF